MPPAHHETIKHDYPNETKLKRKTKPNCPGFEFKPRQVSDSSQSNQGNDHLVSQRRKSLLQKLLFKWLQHTGGVCIFQKWSDARQYFLGEPSK
jgi:hypothetical protein